MPETEIRAKQELSQLEYQKFAQWYRMYYGKEPPVNSSALIAGPIYNYWKNYIRPAFWSPEKETSLTAQGMQPDEEKDKMFRDWYKGVYGTAPTEEVMAQGSQWRQAFNQVLSPPATLTNAPGGEPAPTFGGRSAEEWTLGIPQFEWQKQQWEAEQAARKLAEQREWAAASDASHMQNLRNNSAIFAWLAQRNVSGGGGFDPFSGRETQAPKLVRQGEEEAQAVKQRAENAMLFEEWRDKITSTLDPRDWITRQKAALAPNPFAPIERKWSTELKMVEGELKLARDEEKRARQVYQDMSRRVIDFAGTVDPQDVETALAMYQNTAQARDYLEKETNIYKERLKETTNVREHLEGTQALSKQRWAKQAIEAGYKIENGAIISTPISGGEGGNKTMGGFGSPSIEPTGVIAPDWLKEFVPSLQGQRFLPGTGNTLGKAAQIAPLSGQALNRLSPSRLGMLQGYASFAGQQPADWLNQTQVQLPQPLRLGRTWSPARQSV